MAGGWRLSPNDDGQPMLWVRALDTADAHVLPGTEGARRPFWSPDSRSIGFFMNSELKRIEARGGAPQTITYLLAGTNGHLGIGWNDPVLEHGLALAAPRQRSGRGRARWRRRRRRNRPATAIRSSCPERGSSCSSSADRTPCAACIWARSDRRRDAAGGVRHAGGIRRAGWLLFVRQGTLWAQRFDLGRRTISGEPTAVADSVAFEPIDGTGAFSTSDAGVLAYRAGRSDDDTAVVVRSVRQSARHARIVLNRSG